MLLRWLTVVKMRVRYAKAAADGAREMADEGWLPRQPPSAVLNDACPGRGNARSTDRTGEEAVPMMEALSKKE